MCFKIMSSLMFADFREIIEPARICSSCPRGVAPGSCRAARSSAPDNTAPHPPPHQPASSSATVLTSGWDLSYFGGHICGLHMFTRTHDQSLVATTRINKWPFSFLVVVVGLAISIWTVWSCGHLEMCLLGSNDCACRLKWPQEQNVFYTIYVFHCIWQWFMIVSYDWTLVVVVDVTPVSKNKAIYKKYGQSALYDTLDLQKCDFFQ